MIHTAQAKLKPLARKIASGLYDDLVARRNRMRQLRLTPIIERLIARHGFVVQNGPFAGMTYLSQATGSMLAPKLLGSYEAELHPALIQTAGRTYEHIVDIGCAEGYYAVGLALQHPEAHVYAFDVDPRARRLCATMAHANGVGDRVTVAGVCDIEHLAGLTGKPALIVCDCEGCELNILKPDSIPGLRMCDVLVELHEPYNPTISPSLLARFANSHTITLIPTIERNPGDYDALRDFKVRDCRLALSEFRAGAQQWAFMVPKPNAL